MKCAIEFVRDQGLENAKLALDLLVGTTVEIPDNELGKVYKFEKSELKKLINSHELVERMGGVDKAKHEAYLLTMNVVGFNPAQLEQAIADVESCQGEAS